MADDIVSQLELLIPNTLTDAGLTSSVPEADYPVYVAGTTYGVADRVIKDHHIYESLRASNLGHDPSLVASRNGVAPWWNDLGFTNRWCMFDQQNSTQTVATGTTLTVVMSTGSVGSIFSSNIDADYVDISIKDIAGGTVFFTKHIEMETSEVSDYDQYFFDDYEYNTSFLVDGIDVYFNPEVTVTYTKTAGAPKVGSLFAGRVENLGETQFGVTLSPRTFSTIGTDKFGTTSITRRPFATDMKATAIVDQKEANKVVRIVQKSLDIPCVVIGSNIEELSALQAYGLVSASFSYNYWKKIVLTLSVNGMI